MEEHPTPASSEAAAVTTTVEIRIRTLDSSNYTIRVDKDMPVPALKDRLASVVGVPSQNQRLICRGRVLKDDQLLSSYNVEDGHTLHLVARPPAVATEDPAATQAPTDTGTRHRPAHVTHSLLLGTINIPEIPEGGIPDLSRILSAVLNSVGSGATALDSRRGVAVMQVASTGPSSNAPSTAASTAIPSSPAPASEGRRSAAQTSADSHHLRNLEIVPDALTTISQYLTRMEQAFADYGYDTPFLIDNTIDRPRYNGSSSSTADTASRPLPTPASLSTTIFRVRELLHGQASSALAHLASQLVTEGTLTDTAARVDLQSTAVWSGNIMQQLGALLMELGRTTLLLQLGTSPAQAVVNSGPAVFVSPSGPNPMMVQPLPFQTGLPLGAFPLGTAEGTAPGARTVNLNLNAADSARRPFTHIPLFGSSLRNFQHTASDLLASALEPTAVEENVVQPGDGSEPRQSPDATRSPSDAESMDQNIALLIQDNGSVRLVPVRARTAASVNLSSSLFRGLRSSSEAISVPVLGIRAQVHTHPWTQAVLQASEGQRPVGIAVTIPVDVTTSRVTGNASADTGVDSVVNANSTLGEVHGTTQEHPEQAPQGDGSQGNQMDTSTARAEGEESVDERSSRKRSGEASDAAETCAITSPDYESRRSWQEGSGSGGKRQKTEKNDATD